MRLPLFMAVLLGLLTYAPQRAAAWHRDGHFAIARIAWKQLEPGEQLAIAKLLKAHPHYDVYLADERPKELVTEAEWAFLRASTWSDWVRAPQGPGLDAAKRQAIRTDYNRPSWHYINLPFIHPRDADQFDAAAIRKEVLVPAFDAHGEPRHAVAAIDLAMKQLRTPAIAADARAVALCWLAHLVGDLHQPLHGTGLIAAKERFDPPEGDRGGNRLVVKPTPDSPTAVNLHFYWDAVLFRDEPGIAGVDGRVAKMLSDPKLGRDQLAELRATDPLAWAEESLVAAQAYVYRGKDGLLRAYPLPLKGKTSLKGIAAPPLPPGYAETADLVATRRMVLAGYRLADGLHQVFGTRSSQRTREAQ